MELPDVFSRYRTAVNDGLVRAIGEERAPVYDMLRYHLGWIDEQGNAIEANSGKAVRPSLCLFSCEAVGGAWRQALPAAVAIEMIHNFSLIHDDMQDGDTERRHRSTVWYLWGHSHGLNAGVAMNVLGNLTAFSDDDPSDAETALAVSRILTEACIRMIEGQVLDISFEQRRTVGVHEYMDMISKKTGALLAASLHMGAVVGTSSRDSVDGMLRFGDSLGRLFQVRDDMLGVWGLQEKTGKPRASDLRRRKKSLPVVHALSAAEGETKKRFLDLYGTDRPLDDNDIDEILSILDDLGTEKFCRGLAEECVGESEEALSAVELSASAREECAELTQFLLEREY